ncbi:lytic transglycosylase domain-containing protein [soil metagenome]
MRQKLFLLLAFFLLTSVLNAQWKDSLLFVDDPIAAMLDSLMRNSFIANIPRTQTQHGNKYHFAKDSIPPADPILVETRLAKLNAQSPFDLVYNYEVQAYINLYSIRNRKSVERMLGLSELYYPMFEEQLDKFNLPLELKHLAVIESALNPTATSRSGARGLWQFMYTTGKMYDLQVNSYVDERCDPYLETVAACKLLESLYKMFGDWQMVLAAYNAGPGTINKAIRRAGGGKKTYWEIRPFLPKETQGYVPAFIAATYVMTYHAEHNLWAIAPRKTFYDVDTVAVRQQVTFAQLESVLGISHDELEFLNPMYKLGVIPVSFTEPYKLVLPVAKVGNFINNEVAIYNYIKTDTAMTSLAVTAVKTSHTVTKGETITSISRRYKCSVTDIRAWNGLKSNTLHPGQKLVIYSPGKVPVQATSSTTPTEKTPPAITKTETKPPTTTTSTTDVAGTQYNYYTVKNGDNLWTIANKFGTTVDALKKLNGYGAKVVLHSGDKIKVGKL